MQRSTCPNPHPWAARVASYIVTEVRHLAETSCMIIHLMMHVCTASAAWWQSDVQHAANTQGVAICLCQKTGAELARAFRDQHEADFEYFLRLRAREFTPRGMLLVIVPGRLGSSHCGQGSLTTIGQAASELAAEGRINAETLERFMLPVFFPTPKARFAPHCAICGLALSLTLLQPPKNTNLNHRARAGLHASAALCLTRRWRLLPTRQGSGRCCRAVGRP